VVDPLDVTSSRTAVAWPSTSPYEARTSLPARISFRHLELRLLRFLLFLRRVSLGASGVLILLLGVVLRLPCAALLLIWRARRTSEQECGNRKHHPSHELLQLLGLQTKR